MAIFAILRVGGRFLGFLGGFFPLFPTVKGLLDPNHCNLPINYDFINKKGL